MKTWVAEKECVFDGAMDWEKWIPLDASKDRAWPYLKPVLDLLGGIPSNLEAELGRDEHVFCEDLVIALAFGRAITDQLGSRGIEGSVWTDLKTGEYRVANLDSMVFNVPMADPDSVSRVVRTLLVCDASEEFGFSKEEIARVVG